jgi:integrase
MVKSKRKRRSDKPAKPYPEFPLYAHATKRWAKKIRGRTLFFGPWADPQGALDKYLAQKDDLHAGRTPREEKGGFTVEDLADHFLNFKRQMTESGELSPRTWQDYKAVCDMLVDQFGKSRLVDDLRQEDFAALRTKLAKKWGPVTLGNAIQRVRVVFKFAFDAEHIERPIRFGPGFKRPSKKTLRLERAKQGPKLFSREEILLMLLTASPQLEAMILLAVNAGMGNADCGNLRLPHLDLDRAFLDFPRPKTGVARKAVLWPETVEAIRDVLAKRSAAKDPADADLVFVTKYGDA